MDKSLENEIVFINLDGKYIIKCECLDILKYLYIQPIYNIDFAIYHCDKVRIIELYDTNKNNKNIINCIFDPRYTNPLKIDSVISLESFEKNVLFKKNFYFKTFLGAFIYKNKIDDIEYKVLYTGKINGFNNNNVAFNCAGDFLKFDESDEFKYSIYFYNNNVTHCISNNCEYFSIEYYLYDNLYNYEIRIYKDDKIGIERSPKILTDINNTQTIICNKNLKILQVLEGTLDNDLYEEDIDINGVIIDIKEYNPDTDKLETILSKKSEKSFPQELLDFYYLEINFLYSLLCIKNDELYNAKETLLNESLKNNSTVSFNNETLLNESLKNNSTVSLL